MHPRQGISLAGGTSGIGRAAAEALAADGAAVRVVGRDAGRADETASDLRALGASAAVGGVFDVSVPGGAAAAVEAPVDASGKLDGVAVTTGLIGHEPFDIADERWMEVVGDVLLGTTRPVQAALTHLVTRGGTIVTTAAYSIRAPEIARLPYASVRAAVAVFTKGIAKAYGNRSVRANCICPGAIEIAALTAIRARVAEERGIPYDTALEWVMVDEWGLDVALAQPGRPEAVGELIAFLLSPRAGYLTGALINTDGGNNF